jgi:hypothetical protein
MTIGQVLAHHTSLSPLIHSCSASTDHSRLRTHSRLRNSDLRMEVFGCQFRSSAGESKAPHSERAQ